MTSAATCCSSAPHDKRGSAGGAPRHDSTAALASAQIDPSRSVSASSAQAASVYSFRYNAVVAPITLVAMPLGGLLGGTTGLLWGAVIARTSGLLVLWPAAWKRGFLRPEREMLAVVYLGFGYALGWLALAVLPEPP